MAKITFTEEDLTTVPQASVTENITYVPGYAIKGPVNEPTVVRSLSQFVELFGPRPYLFKATNEYEKSYIYAYELLRMGLPIMFERISVNPLDKATGKIKFYDKKLTGSAIQTEVTAQQLGEKTLESYSATIGQSIEEGSLVILIGSATITDDGESKLFSDEVEVGAISDYTTGAITFTIPEVGTPVAAYTLGTPITWEVTGTVVDKALSFAVKKDGVTQSGIVVTLNGQVAEFTIPNLYTASIILTESRDTLNTGNEITLTAKYPGAYGNDIQYTFEYYDTDDLTGDKLYSIELKYENVVVSDNVSLDRDSDRFIGKLSNSLVDLIVTLQQEIVDLNLFEVETDGTNLEVEIEGDEITQADIISELKRTEDEADSTALFNRLADRSLYNVKFITSGAYPSIDSTKDRTIAKNMLRCATLRGEAIALVDFDETIKPQEVLSIVGGTNLYEMANSEDIRKYGSAIYPACDFNVHFDNSVRIFSGAFAYLKSLAVSQRTNPNWLAIAGTSRGLIPDIVEPRKVVTGSIADSWQEDIGISVNPIMNIRPAGYCIWGNRTLNKNINGLVANSFSNIRVLTCDIKKIVADIAKTLTFEINNDVLWSRFKSELEKHLDQMVTGRGLEDYKVVRQPSTKRATVTGLIRLVPIEAAEDFEIKFTLEDSLAVIQ